MKAIHLSDALEFKRKPPKLKFDILEFLALRGNFSKTGLRNGLKRYYSDISHSVDDLRRDKYIEVYNRQSGRGKDQVYFAITEKGLKALLTYDGFDPMRFWEILHGYCQNSDRIVTLYEIEEFYQIVIRRHLKYSVHGFSSQLDIFDDLCNNWFQETIVKSNGISPLQKVIETLASSPKITFKQILEKAHEPEKRVKEILSNHSYTSRSTEESLSFEMLNQEYINFLIQNIIITKQGDNHTELIYELSLFGVMLCLALIRCNDMGRLKGGLYDNYSFRGYYDSVASNYKEKLPLIFGKWNQLRGILREYAYYNFDIVLRGKIRSNSKDLRSIRKGGNKQLIEGIKEIILDNRELMSNFALAGWNVLKKYIIMQSAPHMLANALNQPDLKRVYWLCAKLKELQVLLRPTQSIFPTVGMSVIGTPDTLNILRRMEESFEDEITAFYYMNLYNDSNIRVSDASFNSSYTPKQCLSLLLKQDKNKPHIKERLSKWRDNLTRLQSEVLDNIKAIV
jgi:DNA-binding PadR family transcriptional regulator